MRAGGAWPRLNELASTRTFRGAPPGIRTQNLRIKRALTTVGPVSRSPLSRLWSDGSCAPVCPVRRVGWSSLDGSLDRGRSRCRWSTGLSTATAVRFVVSEGMASPRRAPVATWYKMTCRSRLSRRRFDPSASRTPRPRSRGCHRRCGRSERVEVVEDQLAPEGGDEQLIGGRDDRAAQGAAPDAAALDTTEAVVDHDPIVGADGDPSAVPVRRQRRQGRVDLDRWFYPSIAVDGPQLGGGPRRVEPELGSSYVGFDSCQVWSACPAGESRGLDVAAVLIGVSAPRRERRRPGGRRGIRMHAAS